MKIKKLKYECCEKKELEDEIDEFEKLLERKMQFTLIFNL